MARGMEFTGGPFGTVAADSAALVPASISGKVFYVNANAGGTDDKDAPWPDVDGVLCFSTLQAAIDACVDGRGDTIYVKRGGEAVTTAVNFNCAGIRVIAQRFGMNPSARGEYTSIYSTTITDGPCAIISKYCYIEGLAFAGADATGSTTGFFAGAALKIGDGSTNVYGVHLKQCRFPKWDLDNSHGISIDGTADVSNVLIEECEFEGAFASGIYVEGSVGHLQIKNCTFALCTYAIETGQFYAAGIYTQLIIGPGNVTITPTKGINQTSNNVVLATVYGNYWGTAVASTHSDTVTNMETDGYICVGNYYLNEERNN